MQRRIRAGRAVVNAQRAFFKRWFGNVASRWKADATRVTVADISISENILAALQNDFPEDVYCSEEANPQEGVVDVNSEFSWVLDPIDGTNNYALGFPLCAISLALLYMGDPIYGFIYDYSTDSLLEGGPGQGVFRDQKKLDDVPPERANTQMLLGLHFPMTPKQLNSLTPLMGRYRVRSTGSSALSAVLVATGYLAGVVDFRVKVWDIAAAYPICLGAGVEFNFWMNIHSRFRSSIQIWNVVRTMQGLKRLFWS